MLYLSFYRATVFRSMFTVGLDIRALYWVLKPVCLGGVLDQYSCCNPLLNSKKQHRTSQALLAAPAIAKKLSATLLRGQWQCDSFARRP